MTHNGEQPSLLADRSTHDMVIAVLDKAYPQDQRALKVLDVPCGAGAVAVRMRDMGFSVACCDIDRGNLEADGFEFAPGNLNRGLPFEEASQDIVVSIAGIQRLICPEVAVHEFFRILKPGGMLYLTCPNYSNLKLRLRYLLYGSLGKRFDTPRFRQTIKEPEANFRFPITYARVAEIVKTVGFSQESLHYDTYGHLPYLMFPFTVLIRLNGWLQSILKPDNYKRYLPSTSVNSLRSRSFLIVARKPNGK